MRPAEHPRPHAAPKEPSHQRQNRSRWCKGRVGTPHSWGGWEPCVVYGQTLERIAIRRCVACGRKEWDFHWNDRP